MAWNGLAKKYKKKDFYTKNTLFVKFQHILYPVKIEYYMCTLLIIKLKLLNLNFSVAFYIPSLSSDKLYLETPTSLFLLAYGTQL